MNSIHGHAGNNGAGRRPSRTYNSWSNMIARCCNPKSPKYAYYGGRGIQVCAQWRGKGGFEQFLKDMGVRPEGKTLDREYNGGNYTPNNCKWATPTEQRLNRRACVLSPKLLCKRGHMLIQGPRQRECRICRTETVRRCRERIKNG